MNLLPLIQPFIFQSEYPHITEFFFENFDKQSQKNARLVSESWQNCIDNQNILWKILFEDKDGEEAFPAACLYGNLKMAKILIQKSVEF